MLESPSTSMKELLARRAQQLFRILVNTDFFGPSLPSLGEIIQDTRLPRNTVQEALSALEREGIIQHVERLYRRVYPPQALKKYRIGILTHANIFHNAYGVYQDFLLGLADSLTRPDIQLSLAHDLGSLDVKIVEIDEMLRSGVNSMILLGRAEKEIRHEVVSRKIPTVICGNATFDQSELTAVCNDNYGGMRSLVQHVIEKGHTNIAYYTADVARHDGFHRRLLGYREALSQAHLPRHEEMVFWGSHDNDSSESAAGIYMSSSPRPTAIVCGCDRDAYELVSELHRLGVKVPEEVGVTGFGNHFFCEISDLSLTTMDIQAQEVGRLAGQHLLQELDHPQIPLRIMVPTTLVRRSSLTIARSPNP